jgi:hypothetical protein
VVAPTNGWSTIAYALLIPISFWTGWIDSVPFVSLITVIGLALGSLSACSQPESRVKKRLVTLLRVCEIVIMIAVATIAALVSRRSIVLG